MMLGAPCSPCCSCTCPGTLPNYATLHIGTIPKTSFEQLVTFAIGGCIGSGGVGKFDSPIDTPGALSNPVLTAQGSGYAVLGRQAPQMSATVSQPADGGTQAQLSVTVEQATANACNCPRSWRVASVSVSNGGQGYTQDAGVLPATITFSSSTAGATINVSPSAGAVTISFETITVNDLVFHAYAFRNGAYQRVATNAVIVPTLQVLNANSYPTSECVGQTIQNAGSGLPSDIEFFSTAETVGDSGVEVDAISGLIVFIPTIVDGSVTAVELDPYTNGGNRVRRKYGSIVSVAIAEAGDFWKQSASFAPCVATPTVSVAQIAPSNGASAALSATVDDNTSSANFGKITGVSVVSGGTGYIAKRRVFSDPCLEKYSNKSFRMPRCQTQNCTYKFLKCDTPPILASHQQLSFLNGNWPCRGPAPGEWRYHGPNGELARLVLNDEGGDEEAGLEPCFAKVRVTLPDGEQEINRGTNVTNGGVKKIAFCSPYYDACAQQYYQNTAGFTLDLGGMYSVQLNSGSPICRFDNNYVTATKTRTIVYGEISGTNMYALWTRGTIWKGTANLTCGLPTPNDMSWTLWSDVFTLQYSVFNNYGTPHSYFPSLMYLVTNGAAVQQPGSCLRLSPPPSNSGNAPWDNSLCGMSGLKQNIQKFGGSIDEQDTPDEPNVSWEWIYA